ncbi:pirin family protein [Flavobacterium sp. ANB]|uniref:pirin family protein n=1 Tax=unclassified Flavobacterium TaxID=196869 RepID=UPI0012B9F6D0|nr:MULTISPECIES: pirin family protein [unclassified Flavobacterium]MBF4519460.1 pirin family protein [Flavobacterium sp. ANB]MTD72539.1 pirin family protein [Flavobacterium sp. LC2016-13]
MDRKDFIKKGLLGTGMFVASAAVANIMKNDIDEIKPLEPVGFNHLPSIDTPVTENSILHKAESRGHSNHGWLDTHQTFSFASYYNPDRMHFGVLRVLNDDVVDPSKGFGTHPHDNMEIISIPLEGDLEHKDSMNNVAIIKKGDIQVMSAGTGIYHSEFNNNQDKPVKFLQIWLYPNRKSVIPRYDQITLKSQDRHNKFQQILSPDATDEGVWIYQDAWFHLGIFDNKFTSTYQIKKKGNGVYAFIIKGSFLVNGTLLNEKDGMGIWDLASLEVISKLDASEILLMEVPMTM